MAGTEHATEFRELRRSDLPSFEKVIVQGYGALERATGLDVSATSQLQSLRGRGVWTLLQLLRAFRVLPLRFLVAVENGQVVGTTFLAVRAKAGYIGGVATDAPARGRGIATHLIENAHDIARSKKKPWLALDVESENHTAVRVYRRLGYSEAAQYRWYVGPPPSQGVPVEPVVSEIRRVDRGTVEWVGQSLPGTVREALPPNSRTLTHLELFVRPSRSRPRTWRLTSEGRAGGVVRGHYGAATSTGFVLPIGADPSSPRSQLAALVAPAVAWQRSLGATRIVLVLPEPIGEWASLAESWGLSHAVSSTLMVRPSVR